MSEILDAVWFMEMGHSRPIGIVLTKDEIDSSLQAYIGTGIGIDEKIDRIVISQTGAKFPLKAAAIFFLRVGVIDESRDHYTD